MGLTRYADRVKELKKGGSGSGNLSKEDKLAKQLMLPRMNKNSKQILVQKKKVGGPVLQKYDVKHGVSAMDKVEEEPVQKLKPVKPITPKGMLAERRPQNDLMKGMFYSKKDLLKSRGGQYKSGKREESRREGESREQMMYRILKNKGKKEDSEKEEEDSGRKDFESYKNKFYKKKEKMYETPVQKEQMNVRMVRKSNSMLPSSGMFLAKEKVVNEYGRESDVDLMSMPLADDKKDPYIRPIRRNHRKNPTIHGEVDEGRSRRHEDSSGKKSSSMKPQKKDLPDPFKDFIEREKKYDKDILREMLELEDKFTQDYSRHIDAMVSLVKKDIAMQASIRDEKGPMKFEESISRVKKILNNKRDSLDLMEAAIRRFEDKFEKLKVRKEKMKKSMKGEPMGIKYTRPQYYKEEEGMRPVRNMQGFRGDQLGNSKSMYGLGMAPSLKPLKATPQKQMKFEYQYQGFGSRNGHKQEKSDHKQKNMMMMGMKPINLNEKLNLPGSKKELRPLTKDTGKGKLSMLPQKSLNQRQFGDENQKDSGPRGRTDTEVTKDLMNDLDAENDLSLI